MRTQLGFTIIELMITVTVAAILMAIAVPGFQDLIANNQRAAVVNDFMASLHIARSEAITRNTRVVVCASTDQLTCDAGTDWSKGWMAFADADNDRVLDAGEVLLDAHQEVPQHKISSSTFLADVSYRPNGRVMAADVGTNTGEFKVCDDRGPEYSRIIIIGPSGRPRSSPTTAGGVQPDCPAAA